MPKRVPVVVGHRGAPGYFPEHTLASYEKAIRCGADFIEPDLVATKDGFLIVRHEPMLSGTTDIENHPEFLSRKRTRILDGKRVTDYFCCDFTLSEIQTLKARQSMAGRDSKYNDIFDIATFEQVIDLAISYSKSLGKSIGIYPETKSPTFHAMLGLDLNELLLRALGKVNYTSKNSPIIIQSFETSNLKQLRKKTDVRLMQLIGVGKLDREHGTIALHGNDNKPYDWVVENVSFDYRYMLSYDGLETISTYADIVGPWKYWLLGFAKNLPIYNREIISNAHKLGLHVHVWTMRNDRLDEYYSNDPIREYMTFFQMGIDGLFSDFPDTAFEARRLYLATGGSND